MRIEEIQVRGLFDHFDYVLTFPKDERVTIMIAPNGSGKTTILRLINRLFNRPVSALARMHFGEVEVRFDDGSSLLVQRQEKDGEDGEPALPKVVLTHAELDGEPQVYEPSSRITSKEIGIPLGVIEDLIPVLDQIGRAEWRHRGTGETLQLPDVIHYFGDELPITPSPGERAPDWLQHLREAIPVRFIDAERLTQVLAYRRFSSHRIGGGGMERTVRRYSEELGQRLKQTLTEYGTLSQSLDRTFPARVVAETPSRTDLSLEALKIQLAEVEEKRKQLIEAGVLEQDQEDWRVPKVEVEQVDDTRRGVLAVYAQDAKKKLSVFDDLLAKVETLKRIANARFLHKQVSIGEDGVNVLTPEGRSLQLEMLSSGEQHELVMLCELLFKVSKNSFVLIDEPELSFHVAWQEKFLSDIEEMAQLSDFRVLLATHSPQIIGARYDLTIELKSPD